MIEELIQFIYEVDKLKEVKRKTFNYHSERYENSAEHSWHLVLSVLCASKMSDKSLDIEKCLKMAILHDVVEIDAGDTIVYAKDDGKFDRELKAAKRIFGLLPDSIAEEFLNLWIEFEKKETEEAKFVGAFDRFLPLYSNIVHKGKTWRENNITRDMIYALNEPAIRAGDEKLWQKTDELLNEVLNNVGN